MIIKLNAKPFNILIMQAYAPTPDFEKSEERRFYEEIDEAIKKCKSAELVIVTGGLNAKVGNERADDIVGSHGFDEKNERGGRWREWCCAHDPIIAKSWFQQEANVLVKAQMIKHEIR